MAFDKAKYDNEYQKQNYYRAVALIPKEKAREVKALADTKGISVSQLIVEALETCYKLNLSKY